MNGLGTLLARIAVLLFLVVTMTLAGPARAAPPTITSFAPLVNYTQHYPAVAVAPAAVVNDVDGNWMGGRLTLQNAGPDDIYDVLAFSDITGFTVVSDFLVYDGATLIAFVQPAGGRVTRNQSLLISFPFANPTNAQVQRMIRAITFSNSAPAPDGGNRFIQLAVQDGANELALGFPTVVVQPAVSLSAVQSRKLHAGTPYDLPINPSKDVAANDIDVEPRAAAGGHRVVFQFSGAVTQFDSVSVTDEAMAPIGSATAVINPAKNTEVIATLSNLPDRQRVRVALSSVNIGVNAAASLAFMPGDISANRAVNAVDLSALKAQSGLPLATANARYDFNLDGAINGTDLSMARSRSGVVLP